MRDKSSSSLPGDKRPERYDVALQNTRRQDETSWETIELFTKNGQEPECERDVCDILNQSESKPCAVIEQTP
jgi:hypothetical protein